MRSIIFHYRIDNYMERSKKLARDGLIELGFMDIYLAPPTPRPTRKKGHKGFVSAGSNDPFGFDAIAASWKVWYGVQATEEGHGADRRGKVDKGLPVQPPNTIVDVWEYVFKKDENDKRKIIYRINLSRRFNVGTIDAPVLKWFLLKKGVWRPVAVRGMVASRSVVKKNQKKISEPFCSTYKGLKPKAATTWVALKDGAYAPAAKHTSSIVNGSPRQLGGVEAGEVVH